MQVIFDLLKEALFDKSTDITVADADTVFNEAKIQGIAPLVFSTLTKKGIIDKAKTKEYLKEINPCVAKNNGVFIIHTEISSLFKEIKHTTIKGVASAKYYKDPFSRIMGDVDVIAQDFDKAYEILINNGYKPSDGPQDEKHVEFVKKNVLVELHRKINGIPADNKKVTELFCDLYDKAESYQTVFGEVTVPGHFHHGLIMLLHMYGHFNAAGIGLRHLCDWAVFVNSFSDEEFKSIFEEKLKSIGMWRFARIVSQASVKLGLDYKPWMGKAEPELADFILDDVVAGGNFGRKDTKRTSMLSLVPKDGQKKSLPLTQYLKHGKSMIYKMWPWAEKYKILFPLAFVAYCFRILFRIISGKTKIYNLNEGYTRREIFDKLRCFKNED